MAAVTRVTFALHIDNRPNRFGRHSIYIRITQNRKHRHIKTSVELPWPSSVFSYILHFLLSAISSFCLIGHHYAEHSCYCCLLFGSNTCCNTLLCHGFQPSVNQLFPLDSGYRWTVLQVPSPLDIGSSHPEVAFRLFRLS